jgi:uncharacterized protein YacL
MIIYNIKSFITVVGFFVGLLYSVITAVSAIDLVFFTILFTIGFYSFANLFLAFYIKNLDVKISGEFPKQALEEQLDSMIKDLEKREEEFMPRKESFGAIIDKQIEKIEESQQ